MTGRMQPSLQACGGPSLTQCADRFCGAALQDLRHEQPPVLTHAAGPLWGHPRPGRLCVRAPEKRSHLHTPRFPSAHLPSKPFAVRDVADTRTPIRPHRSDGSILLSGSSAGELKAWDVAEGKCVSSMSCSRDPLTAVAINSDGTLAYAVRTGARMRCAAPASLSCARCGRMPRRNSGHICCVVI